MVIEKVPKSAAKLCSRIRPPPTLATISLRQSCLPQETNRRKAPEIDSAGRSAKNRLIRRRTCRLPPPLRGSTLLDRVIP